ncbi:ester cyclase [Caulobacter soli]|uniref:ester cyclase n=1 Tax=Caulobacter soli TaxID=2708539 RepID=UPI0013EA244C|nr:ester cyclase [Caulobacter soli]
MSIQEENKAAVRRFNKDFVETGDRAIFDELVAEDFQDHAGPGGAPAGREAAFMFFTVFRGAFPDLKVVVHDQYAERDAVITRKSYQGTHLGDFMGMPASNRVIDVSVIDILRLRDGKQVEHWANADMAGLMQQLKPA